MIASPHGGLRHTTVRHVGKEYGYIMVGGMYSLYISRLSKKLESSLGSVLFPPIR